MKTACLHCYKRTLQGIFCILQAPETQNEQNNIPDLLLLIFCFNYRPMIRCAGLVRSVTVEKYANVKETSPT